MRYKIVEVTGCSGERFWYRDHIGEQFFVTPIFGGFMVATKDTTAGIIDADDCMVVGDAEIPDRVFHKETEPRDVMLVLCA